MLRQLKFPAINEDEVTFHQTEEVRKLETVCFEKMFDLVRSELLQSIVGRMELANWSFVGDVERG